MNPLWYGVAAAIGGALLALLLFHQAKYLIDGYRN